MSDKTDKNEPGRFLGEGVSFRAKLIGVLEVPEARGDRMCQEALADLKMAIRAAGEHKQRIQVHVAIDGLRLRDDKTGDSLYHHPVHKISFIAQDMTDSRAFGYIFGSPDTGHRFFGIKTDKAASQVVIAMRDLFQVVFELKKKEVEMAKQQLEGKSVTALARHIVSTNLEPKIKTVPTTGETSMTSTKATEVGAEGGVAELVDLEQELCSLRRGLTQVEGLTPSTDPFGDSFIAPTSQKGLIPPPPSGSSTRGRNTPAAASRTLFSPSKQPATLPFDIAPATAEFEHPPASFDNLTTTTEPTVGQGGAASSYDVFTELDPLGTGRSKPYVDKKLFFQELKNPPKKVLKDLVPTQTVMSDIVPVPEEARSEHYGPATTMTSLTRHSGGSVAVARSHQPFNMFQSDPFAETDPFDSADPFSDSFKEDPFTTMQEFPKSSFIRPEELKSKPSKPRELKSEPPPLENGRSVFNGPLQVSLPPEPAPKSPRLQRQNTDSSTVRQRPQGRVTAESASPPPPLPPKKCVEVMGSRPPPRPPLDHDDEEAPPLPRPARKKEPAADRSMKPRLSSAATNSSEEEYLTPAPPPLPAARRFDITLSQLLTCTMDELANRLRVPATTLSSMTLPQLTEYLRSYLAADNERAHIHVEPSTQTDKRSLTTLPTPPTKSLIDKPKPSAPPLPTLSISSEFKPQFEDNFTPPLETGETFVANFDDFDQKANPSYDRYAAFREIQEQELKAKSLMDPVENEPKQDSDEKEELTAIDDMIKANQGRESETKDMSRSPLKTLDELTIDSFNMFRSSVSPKPLQIEAKIEDIKSVMKNFQLDSARRSVSPRDNGHVDVKLEDTNDRYAALREITIIEPPPDEFESLPPELPKERKKSDEKSDGFDNSDFFDCIDNSSLSFTHVEDAFRKSPVVKEREVKVEERKEVQVELAPVRDLEPPARLSTGSISDVVSGSSPDTKEKCVSVGVGGGGGVGGARWAVLGGAGGSGGSSDSRDSEPRLRTRRTRHHSPARPTTRGAMVQTSSSSRDVSPWEEDLPPVSRLPRPPSHHRESRHNSSGSRECLDSGSGREKEKIRDKRDMRERDLSRDGRDSGRDRRDSGSGRDRRDSKERDHRRRHRDTDTWDRERNYRERDYRDSRSRERQKDYRDKDRERHRKPRHSYDEEEDYSDGCGSGRSSPRDRWPDQRWRRDERNYGSLGWRETRRRAEIRQQSEDPNDRRYGSTLGYVTRRRREDRSREHVERGGERVVERVERGGEREARRRPRRDEPRRRDYRFSNDFSPHHGEPFDNEFPDVPTPTGKKRAPYSTLEGTRFAFDSEDVTASPLSGSSARARDGDSPATRFRFDSDSISPRSMFEDDFTTISTPRGRTASIAEEDEDVPPLRAKPPQSHRDIKKSESINIFTRESDPFEGDAFFACTGSDRVARRENWPGDFQGFDNA